MKKLLLKKIKFMDDEFTVLDIISSFLGAFFMLIWLIMMLYLDLFF